MSEIKDVINLTAESASFTRKLHTLLATALPAIPMDYSILQGAFRGYCRARSAETLRTALSGGRKTEVVKKRGTLALTIGVRGSGTRQDACGTALGADADMKLARLHAAPCESGLLIG